jgi:hypothetical protein
MISLFLLEHKSNFAPSLTSFRKTLAQSSQSGLGLDIPEAARLLNAAFRSPQPG